MGFDTMVISGAEKTVQQHLNHKGFLGSKKNIVAQEEVWGEIRNNEFYMNISLKNGGINKIQNSEDNRYVNYVVGEEEFANRKEGAEWLGDVNFEYRLSDNKWKNAATAYSSDSRRITQQGDTVINVNYTETSLNNLGIRDFNLFESYKLSGNELVWELRIKNTSDETIEFGSIGLPLMFNSPLNGTEADFYERTTYCHSCIAYNGSYFYVNKNNGKGPILLMYPKYDTKIEYQNWPNWPINFECQTIYICADKEAKDNPKTEYLTTSSVKLEAGSEITYTFGFRWADNFDEISKILYEENKIAVTSVPGMVSPTNLPISLDLFTKQEINTVSSEYEDNTVIERVKVKDDHHVYRLRFSKLGENKITVNYGKGFYMTLIFFITEPLEDLILKNCEFICKKQQQRDKSDPCYMGFLPWDMVMENLNGDGLLDEKNNFIPQYYPTGWWHYGGDEMGFSPGLYLSEKNVYWPDHEQIKQLVDYVNVFIYGKMTEKFPDNTYRLHRGSPWYVMGKWETDPRMDKIGRESNEDCWRSYNYLHVINTYYNMYRIQKYYNFDIEGILTANEYLQRAYQLAYTFFTSWMYPRGADKRGKGGINYGNMGETMFPYLVAALNEEGYPDKANWLQVQLNEKAEYFRTVSYPYTSESYFDTAPYEAVYSYAKMAGTEKLVKEVTATNIATRGQTPVWYLYGSDLPSQDGGVALRYMTQLGGWSLLDYTLNYSENKSYDIKLAYGSYLAGWALINSGYYDTNEINLYSSMWYYQGRKGTKMHSVNSWEQILPIYNGGIAVSGESALGFWAALKMASVVVSDDPVFGLYAYGGTVSEKGGAYSVELKDGVRKRIHILNLEKTVSVELMQDRFKAFEISKRRNYMKAEVENSTGTSRVSIINLTGFESGEYVIKINGVMTETVTVFDDKTAKIVYEIPQNNTYNIAIYNQQDTGTAIDRLVSTFGELSVLSKPNNR
jgi:hypothetical protein